MSFHEEEQLHMSLSRPFVLQRHQITPFVSQLTRALQQSMQHGAFTVGLGACGLLGNDDCSRLFAALFVTRNAQRLVALIRAVDTALASFGLQPYYANPVPHVSVAWALPTTTTTTTTIGTITNTRTALPEEVVCTIDRVCVKSGDQLFTLRL